MAEFSAELDTLLKLSKELKSMNTTFTDTAIPIVGRLTIPSSAVPVMAFGFHSAYTHLHTSTEEAAKAVGTVIDEISGALQTVGNKWKEIEQVKGEEIQKIN